MKPEEKANQHEAHKLARLIRISEKDIVKAFKHSVVKDGNDWVLEFDGKVLRNPDKKAVIRDWYTLNGYLVE